MRLDRQASTALFGPLPACTVALAGGGALLFLRRALVHLEGSGVDLRTLAGLGIDAALAALPMGWPIAVGLSAALGVARLRDEGDLGAWATVGVGPARALAWVAPLALAVSALAWPWAHLVGPNALARLGTRVESAGLTAVQAHLRSGRPGVLSTGPLALGSDPGAWFVLGPDRVARLVPGRGVGWAEVDLDVVARRVEAFDLEMLGDPSAPVRVLRARRATTPLPARAMDLGGRLPGRAWSTPRLRAAAQSPDRSATDRARYARLARARDLAPLTVLGLFVWSVGLSWRRARRRSAVWVTASGALIAFAAERVAALPFLAAAGLPSLGPGLLAGGGLLALVREARSP